MAYVRPEYKGGSDYKFTVTDLNDPLIQEWKTWMKKENLVRRFNEVDNPPKTIQYHNGYAETRRKRVFMRIRPRLGKNNPNAKLYRRGGVHYRSSSLDIKPEHGTRFDVYVGERALYKKVSNRD